MFRENEVYPFENDYFEATELGRAEVNSDIQVLSSVILAGFKSFNFSSLLSRMTDDSISLWDTVPREKTIFYLSM